MYALVQLILLVYLIEIHGFKYDYRLDKVPPIFASDNLKTCKRNGDLVCRIQFTLRAYENQSEIWKIIEKTKQDPDYFSNDQIYRFRCLPNYADEKNNRIIEHATRKEDAFLRNFSLQSHVDNLQCQNYSKPVPIRTFDYVVLYSLLAYLCLIATATIVDIVLKYIELPFKIDRNIKIIANHLSIISNWQRLKTPNSNLDFKQLKCMQGIRTYNMMVITGHTLMTHLFAYVSDYRYVENFYYNGKWVMNFGLHIVQTNFLISAWLLAKEMSKSMEDRQLTLPFISKLILQRYLRLVPALTVAIFIETSNWMDIAFQPIPNERLELDFKACQKHWWATIFFINNIFYSVDMCNLGLWYTANEFQMFIISLLFFYVMSKFKINQKIIVWALAITWIAHAYAIYTNNCDVIFHFTPENAKVEHSISSKALVVLYTSIYSNFGSYGIGLLFGMIYYKYKNQKISLSPVLTIIWAIMFFGLPILSVYLSLFHYSRLESAMIGASIKIIYTIGIGIGILGMSLDIGGIIKKICEWSAASFLANWVYCTYIIHFYIVFGKTIFLDNLLDISNTLLLQSIVLDWIKSFVAGLIFHLLVERPMVNIIQLFIPKPVKTEKKYS